MRSFPRSWSFFRALFPGRRRLGTRRAVSRRGRGGALSGIEGLEGRAMMAVLAKLDKSFLCNKDVNECRVRSTER